MSKTFFKYVENLNDEADEAFPIAESIPASIAYSIARFCAKLVGESTLSDRFCDYHEEGIPIIFTSKDLPKLREYYKQVRSNPSEFATSTTTVGRVTYCGNDADYILDIVAKVGKALHTNKVLMI